jgi:hypothetical protein
MSRTRCQCNDVARAVGGAKLATSNTDAAKFRSYRPAGVVRASQQAPLGNIILPRCHVGHSSPFKPAKFELDNAVGRSRPALAWTERVPLPMLGSPPGSSRSGHCRQQAVGCADGRGSLSLATGLVESVKVGGRYFLLGRSPAGPWRAARSTTRMACTTCARAVGERAQQRRAVQW